MKDVKYRRENLALYDYKRVEEHLSAMAAGGWRLESIGTWLWKYRRAEPANVHYAVSYIRDASQFNPGPTESQQSLEDLCAAAGWTKVTDWFQMQIFCSEMESPIPLETEETVRLGIIHQSMKRNFLPGNIFLLVISLILSGRFLYTLAVNPYHILENGSRLFTGPLLLLLSVVLLEPLGHYWLWYRRSAKSVAQGGSCAVPGRLRWFDRLSRGFLILWTSLYILSELHRGRPGLVVYFVVHLLLFRLIVFLIHRSTALFRRLKLSWGLNLFLTLAVDVALCALLIGGLSYTAIRGGWFGGDSSKTYVYQEEEWDVSPMEIPLTVTDLTGETYSHIRRYFYPQGSALLSRTSYRETVLDEGGGRFWLSYEITKPPRWLYDAALEDALAPQEDHFSFRGMRFSWVYTWKEVPAAPWGAAAAYRQLLDGEYRDIWLLVFPDRLVELSPDWILTPGQMAQAGEALKRA